MHNINPNLLKNNVAGVNEIPLPNTPRGHYFVY